MKTDEIKSSVKVVGLNGQISLGKEYAGKQVLIEEREPGVWLVRTALVIPENEMWLHDPQVKSGLDRAIEFALNNPTKKTNDLDAFIEALDDEANKRGTRLEQSGVPERLG